MGEIIMTKLEHPTPFDDLPIEINQMIASFLPDDIDIATFRRISKSTHNAVEGDRLTFWRRRFLSVFDAPKGYSSNEQYKLNYLKRRKILNLEINFKRGTSGREKRYLEVLRDLVLEAYSQPSRLGAQTMSESSNISHLQAFGFGPNNLLHIIFDPKTCRRKPRHRARADKPCVTNPLLTTLQIIFAPCILALPSPIHVVYGFPESQRVVYAHAEERPIFGATGRDLDVDWTLHQLNFWQYHMTRRDEMTLYPSFAALEPDERPRFWTSQLCTAGGSGGVGDDQHSCCTGRRGGEGGAKVLGRKWKGSYAFVDRAHVRAVRAGRGGDDLIQDEFTGEAANGAFQDYTLTPVGGHEVRERWPPLFEMYLRSLSLPESRRTTRAQHRSASPDVLAELRARSFRFDGEGHGLEEEFLSDGWVNPLPSQHGIPGWQRMTMMKYFLVEDETIDYSSLWAYEGVVLPGGQIIVGRWWSPNDGTGEDMYSGPFIMWCVDS